MKHGDLVRVMYRNKTRYGATKWDGPFHGFIKMTPDDGEDAIWQMWCIERQTMHIIKPWHDKVEVVSEA